MIPAKPAKPAHQTAKIVLTVPECRALDEMLNHAKGSLALLFDNRNDRNRAEAVLRKVDGALRRALQPPVSVGPTPFRKRAM